jgi:hypothetical protein
MLCVAEDVELTIAVLAALSVRPLSLEKKQLRLRLKDKRFLLLRYLKAAGMRVCTMYFNVVAGWYCEGNGHMSPCVACSPTLFGIGLHSYYVRTLCFRCKCRHLVLVVRERDRPG